MGIKFNLLFIEGKKKDKGLWIKESKRTLTSFVLSPRKWKCQITMELSKLHWNFWLFLRREITPKNIFSVYDEAYNLNVNFCVEVFFCNCILGFLLLCCLTSAHTHTQKLVTIEPPDKLMVLALEWMKTLSLHFVTTSTTATKESFESSIYQNECISSSAVVDSNNNNNGKNSMYRNITYTKLP